MANLNFILVEHQKWEIESVHTEAFIGTIQWNYGWEAFNFQPSLIGLDSSTLKEIIKFLDEQEQIIRS
jgi:hypothetical protein